MSVRPGRVLQLLTVAGLATGLYGCPGGGQGRGPGAPMPPPVPVELDSQRVAPQDGDAPAERSPLIDILASENQRWYERLSKADQAPAYYIGYAIRERRGVVIEAEDGVITADDDDTQRALDVEVRVGSPALDNRRRLRDPQLAALTSPVRLGTVPFGSDDKAIRHSLWLETDRRYREAVMLYGLVLTQKRMSNRKDASADFVHAAPQVYTQKPATLSFDHAAWVTKMRDCSKRAARGVATRSTCRVDFQIDQVFYVNSEGSKIQTSAPSARFMVSVGVKADDGMPLGRLEQAFAPSPDGLPDGAAVDAMIEAVNRDLDALHKAPVATPFAGPAILEGRAAAVFFHEVFGHRIEGHRQEEDAGGKTFASYVGKAILPSWLSVYDDPTIRTLNGMPLNGFYHFDDEGVPAQRVSLVDDGVLKGFLLGRNPIAGFPTSNGHGRTEPGNVAVARQGNLVVEADRSVPHDELMSALIAEIKKQGKPYGLLFTDISGGFTNTSTFLPQSFKVEPVMTYRVYPDGKKEVVRGVDITGSPLAAFENIISAGRPVETFNGVCGAESGWVPVSASAPSLLLRTLEVERSADADNDQGPVLPPPSVKRGVR
jgi:predicted Zn-dependent protease